MRFEILNRSFEDCIFIKRNKPLGFLVVETKKLKFQYASSKKKRIKQRKRRIAPDKRKRQLGGCLNRHDFAYIGRDTVNQATEAASGIIKAATKDINNIAKQRLNQLISQGKKEVKRVHPKVLRGAIEDIYQRPFRLLRNFGKKQYHKLTWKILKQ